MSLLPEEEYVDVSYFTVTDYVGGIADADVIFGSYFVEGADYFATEYILNQATVSVLTADLTQAIQQSGASLTSSVTMTTSAGIVKTSAILLEYFANLSAQSDRIRPGASALDSSTSMTTTAAATKPGAADFTTTGSLTATVGVIKQGSASISALGSTLIAAGVVGEFFINMPSTATLSASSTITADANSVLSINATQSTTIDKTAGGAASLDSTSAVAVDGSVKTGNIIAANSDFSVIVSGERIRYFETATSSAFDQTAIPQKTAAGVAVLETTVNQTSTAQKTAEGVVEISVVGTQSVANSRTRDNSVSMNFTTGITVAASKLIQFTSEITSTADILATPTITAVGSSNLNTQFALGALGGQQKQFSCSITGFASILTIFKIVHPDQFVYVIPKETRIYSIPKETRIYNIVSENRTYTIEGT